MKKPETNDVRPKGVGFEYARRRTRSAGAALVGIELRQRADLEPLLKRMQEIQLNCRLLDSSELLYDYLS